MLDFYLDLYNKGLDNNPKEQSYVDSLNFDEFKYLTQLSNFAKNSNIDFNYYKDMFWSIQVINSLLSQCNSIVPENLNEKQAMSKFTNILTKAKLSCLGLVSYCD